MPLRLLLVVFLLVACSPSSPPPHLSYVVALQAGTTLWTAIYDGHSVPSASVAATDVRPTMLPSPLPPLPATPPVLPAPANLQAHVISPGTYPALFLVTQTGAQDAFLLASLASPSSAPVLLASSNIYPARTLVAPVSAADIPNSMPQVLDPGPILDFPPLIQDPQGGTPSLSPDALPTAYIAYASQYANPSRFIYDDTLLQQLLWYDNATPSGGILTSGTLIPSLSLANYSFATTAGTFRLFTLTQTFSARPSASTCFSTTHNDFGLPVGSYSSIDVHLVALVVASEHTNAPTRVLTVDIHPLSVVSTPCP